MAKRKLRFWYRRLLFRKEEKMLKKYCSKIMINRYFNILPPKQTLKII